MQREFIFNRARKLMGDIGPLTVFPDESLVDFLDQASHAHPQASRRRLAAVVAIAAMGSKGWTEVAECLRRSVAMGLL